MALESRLVPVLFASVKESLRAQKWNKQKGVSSA